MKDEPIPLPHAPAKTGKYLPPERGTDFKYLDELSETDQAEILKQMEETAKSLLDLEQLCTKHKVPVICAITVQKNFYDWNNYIVAVRTSVTDFGGQIVIWTKRLFGN